VEPQLDALGSHVLEALQQQTYQPLFDNFLSNGDIIELFDYTGSDLSDTIFAYDRTLSADFNELLDSVAVSGCTVDRVVAGAYAPIPAGDEHTVFGLLRLKNTRIELICGDETRNIVLANIIWHLQQWKILTVTSPSMQSL